MHGAFGARLAALRGSAGLTQAGVAERVGVSRRQIAYYESGHGRPPGALLVLMADLFRISTDAMLGRHAPAASPADVGGAVLRRLNAIVRLGPGARPRLLVTLDRFIAAERARGQPRRPRR